MDTNPSTVEALHEVVDGDKYQALVESMKTNGWAGAPIVIVEREDAIPLAITGSHRLVAAEFVGIDVPTVELRDLFAAEGIDYDAAIGEYLEAGFPLYDAIVRITDELPADLIEYYGLDAH